MRFGIIDGKHTLLMMPGRGKFSEVIQGGTHGTMTKQHCTRVVLFLGESQQILCALPRSNVLASREVESVLPAEHGHQSGGVVKLDAQCVGARIRSTGLRCRKSFGGSQSYTEGDLEWEFLPPAIRFVGQG